MRCTDLHAVAVPAYLSWFLFLALLDVAPYCAPGGVRSPWVTRRRVLCARGVRRKGDGLPATALVHARPSLARVLVSRCRARPRSPRSSPRLAGPYRRAPPASRSTGLPTSSKNLSYKLPDVWLISLLPSPSPTFLSKAGYASRASPHLVAVLPVESAVLCPSASRVFPPPVVAPPSMA